MKELGGTCPDSTIRRFVVISLYRLTFFSVNSAKFTLKIRKFSMTCFIKIFTKNCGCRTQLPGNYLCSYLTWASEEKIVFLPVSCIPTTA